MAITNPNGEELQLTSIRPFLRTFLSPILPLSPGPRISTHGFSVDATLLPPSGGSGPQPSAGPDGRFVQALIAAGYELDHKVSLDLVRGVNYNLIEGPQTAKLSLDVQSGYIYIVLKIENGVPQYYIESAAQAQAGGMAQFANIRRTAVFNIPLHPHGWSGRPQSQFMMLGIGQAILHLFKIKIIQAIIDDVVKWLADEVENHLLQSDEGLQRMGAGFPYIDSGTLSQGTYVLFIHGIFSSVSGAFSKLLPPADVLGTLRTKYGDDKVIGYNHYYLSKEPKENASDLLDLLPNNSTFNIICHSRGGTVTRFLTEDPGLIAKAKVKDITFNKVLYVAGCLHGTQLAVFANWKTLLNIYTALAHLAGPLAVDLDAIIGVLTVIAHGLTSIPAVDDLAYNNPLYATLDKSPSGPGNSAFIMANFHDPLFEVPGLQQSLDVVFSSAANDVIVPFDEAGWTKQQGPNQSFAVEFAVTTGAQQKVVMHTEYFEQPEVQDFIKTYL